LAFNEAAATQFFEKSDVLRCIARQGHAPGICPAGLTPTAGLRW
jgi:hypothetical protein